MCECARAHSVGAALTCFRTPASVHVCVGVCVCVHMRVLVCVCICVVYVRVCVYVCMRVCAYALRACVFVRVCLYICVCICVYVCVCVCIVCESMSMRMCASVTEILSSGERLTNQPTNQPTNPPTRPRTCSSIFLVYWPSLCWSMKSLDLGLLFVLGNFLGNCFGNGPINGGCCDCNGGWRVSCLHHELHKRECTWVIGQRNQPTERPSERPIDQPTNQPTD